ncbi:hypothetical protein IWQ60_001876 [Tieghemiomyces parasiticus]|uniref:C2H2-type domain-containing protein n=1 Tax=Tieghemiomyces parasiticus TaxID=78921 RepID=A0A9W8AD61_9FUNG|nr:hypothetical protein IWQ60_001876 [Tieghemiomyces parasiticus]
MTAALTSALPTATGTNSFDRAPNMSPNEAMYLMILEHQQRNTAGYLSSPLTYASSSPQNVAMFSGSEGQLSRSTSPQTSPFTLTQSTSMAPTNFSPVMASQAHLDYSTMTTAANLVGSASNMRLSPDCHADLLAAATSSQLATGASSASYIPTSSPYTMNPNPYAYLYGSSAQIPSTASYFMGSPNSSTLSPTPGPSAGTSLMPASAAMPAFAYSQGAAPLRYNPYGSPYYHRFQYVPTRPYKCTHCNQSFSRNHDLKRHVKIHSGDKPHQCNKCGKSFGRSDALKRHSQVKRCRNLRNPSTTAAAPVTAGTCGAGLQVTSQL